MCLLKNIFLEKKLDTNKALKPQIEDMFKVLIYADDVFSKNKNE